MSTRCAYLCIFVRYAQKIASAASAFFVHIAHKMHVSSYYKTKKVLYFIYIRRNSNA